MRIVGSKKQQADLEEKLKELRESANSALLVPTTEADPQLNAKLESLQTDLTRKDQTIADLNNEIVSSVIVFFNNQRF